MQHRSGPDKLLMLSVGDCASVTRPDASSPSPSSSYTCFYLQGCGMQRHHLSTPPSSALLILSACKLLKRGNLPYKETGHRTFSFWKVVLVVEVGAEGGFFSWEGRNQGSRRSTAQVGMTTTGGVLLVVERRVKVVELALRCLIFCLGVTSAVQVGLAHQVRTFFSVEKTATFTDMRALVFLVAVSASIAGYSLLQALRCAANMVRGTVLFSKPLAWAIFSFDQALAYTMLAAVAAAAQTSVFAMLGQPELQWMKLCDMYGKFCRQTGGGVAMAVVVSLSSAALSCLSAFNLFRLYGNSKRKVAVAG